MKKILGSLLGIFIALLLIVIIAKDVLAKVAIEQAVTRMTGFKTTAAAVQYHFPSTLRIQGLEIRNPEGFQEPVFASMPEIYASLVLPELLKGQKLHLREVRLNLQEVHIERNTLGVSNVSKLTSVEGKGPARAPQAPAKSAPQKAAMPFQLDRLELTIRKVTFEDRSGVLGTAPLASRKINMDLKVEQEVFTDITDSKALVNLILVKVLNSATLGRMLDMDPRQLLGENLRKAVNVSSLTEQAGAGIVADSFSAAKNRMGDTADTATAQVSGLLGKLKSLPTEKPAEKTQ